MENAPQHVVEKLVSDHLYLVQHIVHEFAARFPRHVERQELWSAGATGLVEAARRYESDNDTAFGHYARHRIRGAILDMARQADWATRTVRRDQRQLDRGVTDYEVRHHRTPSDKDLADQLGLDVDEVARRRAAAERGTVLHLDHPISPTDGAASLAETLFADELGGSPESALEHRELVGTLGVAVAHLSDVQREVVERYYLNGDLLRDVADDLGVTEARASQVRAEAIRALRSYLTAAEYGEFPVDESAPGKRERAAFVARVSENSTLRERLETADAPAWSSLAASG